MQHITAPRWLRRWPEVLAWLLLCAGALGIALTHHLAEQAVLAITGGPAAFVLTLPLGVPIWLPWACMLAAILLWQRGRRAAAAADPPGPQPGWISALGVVGLLALILAAGALLRMLPLLDAPARAAAASLDYDEAIYAGVASLMRQGYWPYHDFFMAHPPFGMLLLSAGLWARNAVRIDLPTFIALRQATALLDCLAIIGCYLTVRRLGGPAAGLLAALAYASDGMVVSVGRAIMLESLQSALLLFAAAAYVRCLDSRRARTWAALAGALTAMACLVKLTGGVLAIAMLLHLLCLRRWRELGVLALAGALSGLALLSPFLLHAPAELLSQILLTQIQRSEDGMTPFRRMQTLMNQPDQALIAVGAGLGLLRLALVSARRAIHPGWGMLILWGMGLWAAMTGWASFFPHYYATLALAPACLAGALLLPGAPARLPRWPLTAGIGLVLALVLAREIGTYAQISYKNELIEDSIALRDAIPAERDILIFEPTMAILAGHNPVRLPSGQFFLDTYLWWPYTARTPGADHEQILATFEQAQYVVLNGGELRRIGEDLQHELEQRMRRSFWKRQLAHAQLYYRVERSPHAIFDQGIELLGSDPPSAQGNPPGVQVRSYWRMARPPGPDQAIFLHLLDAQGQRLTQIDLPLQAAARWRPGEVAPIDFQLAPAQPLPDGEYRLVLGVYSFSSGARSVAKVGSASADSLEIARISCAGGVCQAITDGGG